MAITCHLFRDGRLADEHLDPSRISDVIREPGALVWLDVSDPTEADMRMLQEEFGFHELAIEDCLHPHQRPKIEQFEGYFFLVLYGMSSGDGELVDHETAAFVAPGYLVTVRKAPPFDLAPVLERWNAHPDLAALGGGYLLYILLDEIVDGYFSVLDVYEDRTEELEERVISDDGTSQSATEIFALKKQIVRFRRAVAPLRDVLDVLQRRTVDVVTAELEPYYRDVYDHVLRVTDFVDSIRDILSTALEAHLSIVSNRLNVIMKSLTSWGAIVLVPTLIAGIFGMNFTHMPELHWRYGYPYAIGLMVLSCALLYRRFKSRGYL